VIASCVVSVVSNGHEIAQLRREPVVERLRMSSDKVAADEDVEDSGYKCNLLSDRHNFGIVPTPAESIHRLLHALCVPVQLLIWCWYSSPPFSTTLSFAFLLDDLNFSRWRRTLSVCADKVFCHFSSRCGSARLSRTSNTVRRSKGGNASQSS